MFDDAIVRKTIHSIRTKTVSNSRHVGDTDLEAATHSFLEHVAANARERGSAQLELMSNARQMVDVGDWNEAENIYKISLNHSQRDADWSYQYRGHTALSSLYRFLERDMESLEHAHLATDASRQPPASAWLCSALEVESSRLIEGRELKRAWALIEEGLLVAQSEGDTYEIQRVRLLINRARCLAMSNESSTAKIDLEEAMNFLCRYENIAMFAGVQSALASCYETLALIGIQDRDVENAREYFEKALGVRRHLTTIPQIATHYAKNDLAKLLRSYWNFLEEIGEWSTSSVVLNEHEVICHSLRKPKSCSNQAPPRFRNSGDN